MQSLILIDLQNDFVPGGALPVLGGNLVVPVANRLLSKFNWNIATQDWHPPNHLCFAENHPGKKPGDIIELAGATQILWPVHSVQGTPGAAFLPDLDTRKIQKVIQKGLDPEIDSYSGFFDNARKKATGLADYLSKLHITHLFIMGLATDYCVKFTALDAIQLGFQVTLIQDGCRGVDLNPGDVHRALNSLRDGGVKFVTSDTIQ
jgi:nicotinamidase/pyrazinamidase